ncbi:hypothetical protein SAY87_030647 [Trapa incisa]|uniref:Uncharacterized protein n=1 Tax=Trapa incisa TaxID=236973 RepID=A0AAN7KNT0_9MYRT|nr:hypothetical protein SAY87_030647 [Trapa incisa]
MLKPQLLVFCLLLSFILLTSAVPSSRSLDSHYDGGISEPDSAADAQMNGILEDGPVEGRMEDALYDYPNPSPNPGHDPHLPPPA